MECFHSCAQHLCKIIGAKASVYTRKVNLIPARLVGTPSWPPFCSFQWNFNMAAVKSCQNALYNDHHLHIVCIYTSFVILYCIPFRCVRFSSKRARSYFIRRHKLELIFRRTFCLDLLAIGFFSCNIQSGPLIFTFSSVAYCMKQYRAVT